MSFENREKYVERGTGQVFYLWHDDETHRWTLAMFTGGPSGVELVRDFATKTEAVHALTQAGFSPAAY
jgi:hypothetical protein